MTIQEKRKEKIEYILANIGNVYQELKMYFGRILEIPVHRRRMRQLRSREGTHLFHI